MKESLGRRKLGENFKKSMFGQEIFKEGGSGGKIGKRTLKMDLGRKLEHELGEDLGWMFEINLEKECRKTI